MSVTIDKIKERLSIVDVVSLYIKLDPNGTNFKARCPFHHEKTPSFFVSPDRGGYYCFGCNKKGDIFTFVQDFEGVDFRGALKILAEKAGVDIVNDSQDSDSTEVLYRIMKTAEDYFVKTIQKYPEVLKYLTDRGIKMETIERFKIGYVSNEWQSLYDYLKSKKFSDIDIERVGLIKKGDSGKYYDRFRGRIIFPINDSSGRVVAFTGRIYVDDGKSAKYLNSPETELFLKSKTLYGLDRAKFDIKRLDYAILVEGQTDLIMSHQAGFTNTIASSGTAITVDGLSILSRFSHNIMIAFDRDSAGISAARRAAAISAFALDMVVKIVVVPDGKDPADAIQTSVDLWKDAIRNAKDIIVFELEYIVSSKPESMWMKEIYANVFSYLAVFPREMKVDTYIRIITKYTGFSPDSVRNDFNTYLKSQANIDTHQSKDVKNNIQENTPKTRVSIEKKIYGLYLHLKNKDTLLAEKINQELVRILSKERFQDLERLSLAEQELLLFEIELKGESQAFEREVIELLLSLEEEQLQLQFLDTQKMLRRAESTGNTQDSEQLIIKCSEISKKINEIKNKRGSKL